MAKPLKCQTVNCPNTQVIVKYLQELLIVD